MTDTSDDPWAYERSWARNRKLANPSERQLRCMRVAAIWLDGLHHLPDTVRAFTPAGIEMVFYRGKTFATFDYHEITQLVFSAVFSAHDHCVRAEIGTSGMHLAVRLTARQNRDGSFVHSHPTIEDALARWRREHTVPDDLKEMWERERDGR